MRVLDPPALAGRRINADFPTAVRAIDAQVARFDALDDFVKQFALVRISLFEQRPASVVGDRRALRWWGYRGYKRAGFFAFDCPIDDRRMEHMPPGGR